MNGMKPKVIIFDFFGVISSEIAIVWLGKHFEKNEAAKLKQEYCGPVDRGDMKEDLFFAKLSDLTSVPLDIIRQEWLALAHIDRSVVDFAGKLKEKYRLALLSDAPSAFIREIITTNKLGSLFEAIVVSSEVHATKANAEIFKLILDALNVSGKEAIIIDDNPRNIHVAESAGIKGFIFTNLSQLKDDLSVAGIIGT
jgi:putative hydrolase of the HAD superfamily